MKHGVLLIGCGNMANVHCHALAAMPNVRLTSAVDLDIERAKKFKSAYGFERINTDYKQELEKTDIDIVLVATHWRTRFEIIKDCFAAGKHVLAEKPLSVYLDEVDALFAMANEKELKLRVGMMERFRPMFLKMCELLKQDAIGFPLVYNFIHHQSSSISGLEAGWKYSWGLLQGGVTPNIDCGIHKCDLVRMLSGADAAWVMSHGLKLEPDSPSNNYTHSVFHMNNGAVITLEDCWSRNTRPEILMWILGDKGRMGFEYAGVHALPSRASEEDCIRLWRRELPGSETYHTPAVTKPVGPQMETFIKEIETNADMNWHYANVRKATEMVMASALSEKRDEIVHFPLTAKDIKEIKTLIKK